MPQANLGINRRKRRPEVEAQRKRFDAFIDKAATKEDSEELNREKKRVRFEEQDAAPEKPDVDDKAQTETAPTGSSSSTEASSSSGSKSSSSKRGPIEDVEDPERGVRAKVQEKRGEKRPEDADPERKVRATVPEKRWQKRVSEDDGRADLDEAAAAARMARDAAEAGLARAREKSVRIEAVAGRWCDVVDEDWQLDPFLDKQVWSESQRAALEVESGDEGIEDFGFEEVENSAERGLFI